MCGPRSKFARRGDYEQPGNERTGQRLHSISYGLTFHFSKIACCHAVTFDCSFVSSHLFHLVVITLNIFAATRVSSMFIQMRRNNPWFSNSKASNDLDAGLVSPISLDSSIARLLQPLLQSLKWWYLKRMFATWDRPFASLPTAPSAFPEHRHRELYFGTTVGRRHAFAAMPPNRASPYSPLLNLGHAGDLSARRQRNPGDRQQGD